MTKSINYTFLISLFFVLLPLVVSIKPRTLGYFDVQRPGYSRVVYNADIDTYDLFVTTLQAIPEVQDEVYMVGDIGRQLDRLGSIEPELMTSDIYWPNELKEIPADVAGEDGYMWIASGFMVAEKIWGALNIMNPHKHGIPGHPIIISVDVDDRPWFYHRIEWIDMNKDGLKDALTARTYCDKGGEEYVYYVELLWFENPGSLEQTPWVPHVLIDGPDCFFKTVELTLPDGTSKLCIISTQYFTEKLTLTWTEDPQGSWANPDNVRQRVIEEGRGHYFDLDIGDMNNDGRLDVMVTVNKNWNGSVMAYEIPDNFLTEEWPAHLLAYGFDAGDMEGNGAPGSGFLFTPMSEPDRKRPLSLVSGDDDGIIYFIQPNSDDDSNDWNYHKTVIFTSPGMVGSVSLMDVDNDGYEEIFIPAWKENRVYVQTLAPLKNGMPGPFV